jgi:hypothetical protein
VSVWLEQQHPERKAARVSKMTATIKRFHSLRKRELAALTAQETGHMRWYTYAEIQSITGWSASHAQRLTSDFEWPVKRLRRVGNRGRGRAIVFGDISTLPRRLIKLTPDQAEILKAQDASAAAVKPSIWQRIMRWFK